MSRPLVVYGLFKNRITEEVPHRLDQDDEKKAKEKAAEGLGTDDIMADLNLLDDDDRVAVRSIVREHFKRSEITHWAALNRQ